MASNTTLTTGELGALCQVLQTAMRGGDSRVIVRHPEARSAYGKLVRLLERRTAEALPKREGDAA